MDYSCTSKYFLTNQIEKTTTKIIIKMLMILDYKILSLWFVIEDWWYNTLTCENNWFLNVLVMSNFVTPTPFGSVSCFVVGICLSNYNLNSFLIHQASYSKWYQWFLMHREVLGSIWKKGRYPIKASEVLSNNKRQTNSADPQTAYNLISVFTVSYSDQFYLITNILFEEKEECSKF